jgi:hypothetical protein
MSDSEKETTKENVDTSDDHGQNDHDEIHNLLAALVEQARALAIRVSGDPDRETQCHFCDAPLPLWENLLVLQLTGVAAHVQCPEQALQSKLREVGPVDEFPYEEFSEAVDRRLQQRSPTSCSGTIVK